MLDVSGLDAVLIFGLHEEPAVRDYAQQALDASGCTAVIGPMA